MGKRGDGEGTFRRRPNGLWEVRLSLTDGRRKSFYGKSREEVAKKLKAAQRDLERGVDLGADSETVAAFLQRWLDDSVRLTRADRTYASYAEIVRVHIVPTLGRKQLAKLTPADVTALLRAKQGAGLSPRTVQYIRAVLVTALNRAEKWGMVSRNVASLADAPKVPRTEVRPMTPEQARIFLHAIVGDRLEALYRVALSLGLRQGEALALAWSDLDLENSSLRVRHTLQRLGGQHTLKEPKTERSKRTLALPTSVVIALRAHKARQNEERLALGELWHDSGLVFTNPTGGPLDAGYVLRQFKKHLKAADLPEYRFHDLRHSAASFLIVQRVDAAVIRDILGHAQMSTTFDIYGHIFPPSYQEAATLMDELLTG
jgi:integrase